MVLPDEKILFTRTINSEALTLSMTHKERLRRALQHQPVDRLPTQINLTATMVKKLAAHFGISSHELPVHLGNYLVRLSISYPERCSAGGYSLYDWWGAGHATSEEGYYINDSPLSDNKDLDAFAWPDPYSPDLLDGATQIMQKYGNEYFVVPNFGWALFERAWSLRGFEQFFMDMALDAGFVEALLDRIVEIQLVLIHRFLEMGVDGGYFGDDYGAQKGLLFSPRMWRNLIKPRLQRMFAPFLERGLPVLLHSDGQIQQILPDLVEIGLTTLNPVQPEVLDHHWLRDHFGDKLSFYGGISTQTILPQGTPEQVKVAVTECVRTLTPEGTGLLIAPSHSLMSDVPIANVEALLNAFRG
ncbi:MAG: uroporphyrinogen decarboxylase family protein [Anaerolineales bacterium]